MVREALGPSGARVVEVKRARTQRLRIEGERGRRGDDLLWYEARLRFIFWNSKSGVDL
jgi:hypothetical protein